MYEQIQQNLAVYRSEISNLDGTVTYIDCVAIVFFHEDEKKQLKGNAKHKIVCLSTCY